MYQNWNGFIYKKIIKNDGLAPKEPTPKRTKKEVSVKNGDSKNSVNIKSVGNTIRNNKEIGKKDDIRTNGDSQNNVKNKIGSNKIMNDTIKRENIKNIKKGNRNVKSKAENLKRKGEQEKRKIFKIQKSPKKEVIQQKGEEDLFNRDLFAKNDMLSKNDLQKDEIIKIEEITKEEKGRKKIKRVTFDINFKSKNARSSIRILDDTKMVNTDLTEKKILHNGDIKKTTVLNDSVPLLKDLKLLNDIAPLLNDSAPLFKDQKLLNDKILENDQKLLKDQKLLGNESNVLLNDINLKNEKVESRNQNLFVNHPNAILKENDNFLAQKEKEPNAIFEKENESIVYKKENESNVYIKKENDLKILFEKENETNAVLKENEDKKMLNDSFFNSGKEEVKNNNQNAKEEVKNKKEEIKNKKDEEDALLKQPILKDIKISPFPALKTPTKKLKEPSMHFITKIPENLTKEEKIKFLLNALNRDKTLKEAIENYKYVNPYFELIKDYEKYISEYKNECFEIESEMEKWRRIKEIVYAENRLESKEFLQNICMVDRMVYDSKWNFDDNKNYMGDNQILKKIGENHAQNMGTISMEAINEGAINEGAIDGDAIDELKSKIKLDDGTNEIQNIETIGTDHLDYNNIKERTEPENIRTDKKTGNEQRKKIEIFNEKCGSLFENYKNKINEIVQEINKKSKIVTEMNENIFMKMKKEKEIDPIVLLKTLSKI